MTIFGFTFCKSKVRVPFLKNKHFKIYFYFILSFNSKKNGTKKESRMKWKMNEKWVKKVNHERPYWWSQAGG